MRLFACGLCSSDEPFVCTSRFRRTYMRLHLEKGHGVAVETLKFSRKKTAADSLRITWVADVNDKPTDVLIEFQIETTSFSTVRPEPDKLQTAANSPSVDSRNPVNSTNQTPESWTPSAMQDLYRTREGASAGF